MNKPREGCLYYAITLTGDDDHKITFGIQSQWVGWADPQARQELREARLVYPEYVIVWKSCKQPYAIIHTVDELTLFLLGGGNALVEKELAKEIFTELLSPHVSIPDGPTGFLGPEMFEPSVFRRAPSPKIRMRVLNRDGRRCRICGRCPDDHMDVVLHVHHIRPWEKGGVTDLRNLVTLCHTCHIGLEPHEDLTLFRYTSNKPKGAHSKLLEFRNGVMNYRKAGFFEANNQTPKKQLYHGKRSPDERSGIRD